MRVPAIVISPFGKKGYIDSTVYETTSITALIEHRWGLAALGTRDAAAADLTNAFDFGHSFAGGEMRATPCTICGAA